MPKFSAHIGYLFTELELGQRFKAAANAGFKSVEHPLPYLLSKERIAEYLDQENLNYAQLAMPMGGVADGAKGLACLPNQRGEFQDSLGLALEYADALSCRRIHMMTAAIGETTSSCRVSIRMRNRNRVRRSLWLRTQKNFTSSIPRPRSPFSERRYPNNHHEKVLICTRES